MSVLYFLESGLLFFSGNTSPQPRLLPLSDLPVLLARPRATESSRDKVLPAVTTTYRSKQCISTLKTAAYFIGLSGHRLIDLPLLLTFKPTRLEYLFVKLR